MGPSYQLTQAGGADYAVCHDLPHALLLLIDPPALLALFDCNHRS